MTKLQTALQSFVLADAPLAGMLAACRFVADEEADVVMSVRGDGAVFGTRALSGRNAEIAHHVAEAVVHMALGHPRDAAAATVDQVAFDAACRLRTLAIMNESVNLIRGLFTAPEDLEELANAAKAAGIDPIARTAEERDELANRLAGTDDDKLIRAIDGMKPVLDADGAPSPAIEDALKVAAFADGRRNTLGIQLVETTGVATADAITSGPLATFDGVLRAVLAVRTLEDGKAEMERVERLGDGGLPPELLQDAALEMLLGSLKGHGVPAQDLRTVFAERAERRSAEILRAGKLIRL